MADIFDFYVGDDRSIEYALAEPIMLEDYNVTQFRFRIPKTVNGFDMSDWEWWFLCQNADGTQYSRQLTLTDDEDNPDEYSIAIYSVEYGFSGVSGLVKFALESYNADDEENILNEWHTRTYTIKVIDTLQGKRAIVQEPEGGIWPSTLRVILNNMMEIFAAVAYYSKDISALAAETEELIQMPDGKQAAEKVKSIMRRMTELLEDCQDATAEAGANADLAEHYKDLAFAGTPDGYEALVEKVYGIPATIGTQHDILQRKVLALSAGVKNLNRWPLRTYYEVVEKKDGRVKFRFAGRNVTMNMNPNTPAYVGLVTYIYGYGFVYTTLYKTLVVDDTMTCKIYFDGRPKTYDDVVEGNVASTITVYKRLKEDRYLVLKMDATGIHLWMKYNYVPAAPSTLVNESAENPNFVSVFNQHGEVDSVEVVEVDTERSLVIVQPYTWVSGEWHKVDILW